MVYMEWLQLREILWSEHALQQMKLYIKTRNKNAGVLQNVIYFSAALVFFGCTS